jgi:hypothetical protein
MSDPPEKEGGLLEEQATKTNGLPQRCHNLWTVQNCVHADNGHHYDDHQRNC